MTFSQLINISLILWTRPISATSCSTVIDHRTLSFICHTFVLHWSFVQQITSAPLIDRGTRDNSYGLSSIPRRAAAGRYRRARNVGLRRGLINACQFRAIKTLREVLSVGSRVVTRLRSSKRCGCPCSRADRGLGGSQERQRHQLFPRIRLRRSASSSAGSSEGRSDSTPVSSPPAPRPGHQPRPWMAAVGGDGVVSRGVRGSA